MFVYEFYIAFSCNKYIVVNFSFKNIFLVLFLYIVIFLAQFLLEYTYLSKQHENSRYSQKLYFYDICRYLKIFLIFVQKVYKFAKYTSLIMCKMLISVLCFTFNDIFMG
ncbi:hypothetical protein EDEG_02790 [Edhazardia aedis USNM 41457]|uniref:Transmembrane protein n=1 Tax=Edhazardia aedis (strain USNM 41457) TaxID=1003232 RepID=J9D4S6_EDHAE|nr:hypothetical protein EDEG_02790 [Edhazardia aedis USNM 41457]|eukprot:EJW02816.1 hypothetical protein EDEG_02790 [Edhazardia aedis USNM 41457]